MVDHLVLIPVAGITITGAYWVLTHRSRTLEQKQVTRWLRPHQLDGLDPLLSLPITTMRPKAFLSLSHGISGLFYRAQNAFIMVRRCTAALEDGSATLEELELVRSEAATVYLSSAVFLAELGISLVSKRLVSAHGLIALQAYWQISRVMFQVSSETADFSTIQPYF